MCMWGGVFFTKIAYNFALDCLGPQRIFRLNKVFKTLQNKEVAEKREEGKKANLVCF